MARVIDRLYETDYCAWTQQQAALLRRLAAGGSFAEPDPNRLSA